MPLKAGPLGQGKPRIELGMDAVGHHLPAESGAGREATEAADEKG